MSTSKWGSGDYLQLTASKLKIETLSEEEKKVGRYIPER